IRERTRPFGWSCETNADQALANDRKADAQPRGDLNRLQIAVTSEDGDAWHVWFEPKLDFRKPAPYPDRRHLLAEIQSHVSIEKKTVASEDLLLRVTDGVPVLTMADRLRRTTVDEWIDRSIHILSGKLVPGLVAPVDGLGEGCSLSVEQFRIEALQGPDALQRFMKGVLETPPWKAFKDDSRMFQVVGNGFESQRQIVRHVATSDLPKACGQYIAKIYRLDVAEVRADPRSCVAWIELLLWGVNEAVTWRFDLRFPPPL
ncbi:MAG TPA: hypothetical protein VFB89_15010, partial [Gemmatimonadales bacterium]|nr:hypothetical protein [Gemmatimonadales bacterium]